MRTAQLRPVSATREKTSRHSRGDRLSSGPQSQDDKLFVRPSSAETPERCTHTPSVWHSHTHRRFLQVMGPGVRGAEGFKRKDGWKGGRGKKDGWKQGKVGQWPPLAAQETCLMSRLPESRAGGAPAGHTHEYRWQQS